MAQRVKQRQPVVTLLEQVVQIRPLAAPLLQRVAVAVLRVIRQLHRQPKRVVLVAEALGKLKRAVLQALTVKALQGGMAAAVQTVVVVAVEALAQRALLASVHHNLATAALDLQAASPAHRNSTVAVAVVLPIILWPLLQGTAWVA